MGPFSQSSRAPVAAAIAKPSGRELSETGAASAGATYVGPASGRQLPETAGAPSTPAGQQDMEVSEPAEAVSVDPYYEIVDADMEDFLSADEGEDDEVLDFDLDADLQAEMKRKMIPASAIEGPLSGDAKIFEFLYKLPEGAAVQAINILRQGVHYFHDNTGEIVGIKPLDESGGAPIFLTRITDELTKRANLTLSASSK